VYATPIPFPTPTLEAPGLVLRPLASSDYESLALYRDDPETARWVNAVQVATAAELIAASEELRAAGRLLHLAIAEMPTDRVLGEIVLWIRTPEMAEAETGEIAYVVDPGRRGRGIAPQLYGSSPNGPSASSPSSACSFRSTRRTSPRPASPRRPATDSKEPCGR